LALKPSLETMKPGDHIFVIIPKNVPVQDKFLGYKITKKQHEVEVDFLTEQDRKTTEPLAFIDDRIYQGTSIIQARNIFPKASMQTHLLFGAATS